MTKADGTLVTVKMDKDFNVTAVEDGLGKGDPRPYGPAPAARRHRPAPDSSTISTEEAPCGTDRAGLPHRVSAETSNRGYQALLSGALVMQCCLVMSDDSAEAAVEDLVRGAQKALVLRAFVLLGLADHVADGEMTLGELGQALNSPPASVSRLMRAAVALALCSEVGPGRFRLTDAGQLLRQGAPGNAAGWTALMTAPWMLAAWGELATAVRLNNTRFTDVHGLGFWDFVARHPEQAGVFDEAMTSGAQGRASDLLAAVDWSPVRLAVDVGGGQGRLLASVLSEQPQVRGIVLDRPEVVSTPAAETAAVVDRLEMKGGDFFAAIPEGADVYVLSRIVHDWPDRDAITILRTCRAAMTRDARLFLLEQVAPEQAEATAGERLGLALKDLNMLVLVGGQERTLGEYQNLLEGAGLTLDRVDEGATCTVIQAVVRD